MTNINPLGDNYPIPPSETPKSKEGNLTDKLPKKLIFKVLSYLKPQEIQETRLVNRELNDTIVSEINSEYSKIYSFANFLAEKLPDSYPVQQKEFSAFATETNPEISIDLKQVLEISKLKRILLDILTNLKIDDLNLLEKLSQEVNIPHSFENIFDLAIFTVIFNNPPVTDKDLDNYFKLLKKNLNNPIETMELINIIPDTKLKVRILIDIISELLTPLNDIKRAMQILSMISDTETKDTVISDTFDEFIESATSSDFISNMIQITKMISSDETKAECLKDISIQYAKQADFDNAIEIAKQIPIPTTKEAALYEINTSSIRQGRMDEHMKIIKVLDAVKAENNSTE